MFAELHEAMVFIVDNFYSTHYSKKIALIRFILKICKNVEVQPVITTIKEKKNGPKKSKKMQEAMKKLSTKAYSA